MEEGEHEFCQHETCVSYDFLDDMIMSGKEIDVAISKGLAKKKDPVSSDVLARILDGARSTKRIHNASWVELDKQGLFD